MPGETVLGAHRPTDVKHTLSTEDLQADFGDLFPMSRTKRAVISAAIIAAVAIFAVAFPPAGLAALLGSGISLLAVQIAIPSVAAVIMGALSWKASRFMMRHAYKFYYLAAMLLAAGLGALLAPAMPVVLAGAMTAVAWKIFAAASFALAVLGLRKLDGLMARPLKGRTLLGRWGRYVLTTLLLMPLVMVLMPGPLLAFGVSLAPHLLGAGVAAASAHAVSMAFLQGIVASAGILLGVIAAVQTVGHLVVKLSRRALTKKQNPRALMFFSIFGYGLIALAPVVMISVVGMAFAGAGQLMLHAGDLARTGVGVAKTVFQQALAQLPASELVYGAMVACLTPLTTYPVLWIYLNLPAKVSQWTRGKYQAAKTWLAERRRTGSTYEHLEEGDDDPLHPVGVVNDPSAGNASRTTGDDAAAWRRGKRQLPPDDPTYTGGSYGYGSGGPQ